MGSPSIASSNVELKPDLGGELRETAQVLFQRRRFSGLFAEHDLVVDQVENCLGVGAHCRLLGEVGLNESTVTAPPGAPLVLEQQAQERPVAIVLQAGA